LLYNNLEKQESWYYTKLGVVLMSLESGEPHEKHAVDQLVNAI
jgi:hypothetical protein